jgi:hypothetical protein
VGLTSGPHQGVAAAAAGGGRGLGFWGWGCCVRGGPGGPRGVGELAAELGHAARQLGCGEGADRLAGSAAPESQPRGERERVFYFLFEYSSSLC